MDGCRPLSRQTGGVTVNHVVPAIVDAGYGPVMEDVGDLVPGRTLIRMRRKRRQVDDQGGLRRMLRQIEKAAILLLIYHTRRPQEYEMGWSQARRIVQTLWLHGHQSRTERRRVHGQGRV